MGRVGLLREATVAGVGGPGGRSRPTVRGDGWGEPTVRGVAAGLALVCMPALVLTVLCLVFTLAIFRSSSRKAED